MAYVAVWITMEALLGATIGLSRLHLGLWNLGIQMLIAVTMQALVILVYMHVIWSENLVRLFLVAGYFWLSIMIVLVAADYATRFGDTSIISRPGPPFSPPRVLLPW